MNCTCEVEFIYGLSTLCSGIVFTIVDFIN